MKLRTLAVFVISLAAAGIISAQSLTLRANIPFRFVVDGATLPAGEYTVRQPYSLDTVIIGKTDNAVRELTLVVPTTVRSGPQETARLVFHRYGNEYFLSQVWTGNDLEDQIPQTRRERDLIADRFTPNDSVTVALR